MRNSLLRRFMAGAGLAVVLAVAAPAFALPEKGMPAPPLRVTTTAGQKVTLANYRGYVLVLEFFATWCDGCRESLPHVIALNREYGKQGLQVLGLNPGVRGDDREVVRDFMRENRINFPVAIVDDDTLIDYGISPIPAIFIIDKKGVLVKKYIGFNSDIENDMEETIKTLLKQ